MMYCCGLALGEKPRPSSMSATGMPKTAVAANYLIFLRNCRNLFVLMSLISFAIWYPKCGSDVWLDVVLKGGSISVAKHMDKEHLTRMCIDTIVRGLVALCFVERLQRQVQRPFHKTSEEKVIQRTLWLSGIPVYDDEKREYFLLPDEDFKRVSKDLKEAIKSELNVNILGLSQDVKMHVELVPVYTSLDEVSLNLRNAKETREHYSALLNSYHKTCWQRCRSWGYLRRCRALALRIAELEAQEKNILENKKRIAGSAMITFKEKAHSDHFLRKRPHCLQCRAHAHFTFGKPPFTSVTLQCMRAPHPSDVAWVNLHIGPTEQVFRFVLSSSILFVVMVVLVGPVTISSQIDVILPALEDKLKVVDKYFSTGGRQQETAFWTAVSKQLPAMILVAINSMLLPDFIKRISSSVRAVRYSTMEVVQLHLNYIFLVLNAMVIPFLGLSSIGALVEWGKDRISAPFSVLLPRIISTMMTNSGVFALRYILNCACMTTTNSLLQIPQIFALAHSRRVARTARECVEAEEKWGFSWGYWYAWALSIFTMGTCMSSAIPSILPFGALFFGLQFSVDRHNLLFGVYTFGGHSENLFIIRAIHYLRCIIGLWWFLMSFTLLVNLESSGSLGLPTAAGDNHFVPPDVRDHHFVVKAVSGVLLAGSLIIPFCSWCNLQLILFDSQFEVVDVSERGLFRRLCCCCFACCCLEKKAAAEYRDVNEAGEDDYESDFGEWERIPAQEMLPLQQEMLPLQEGDGAATYDFKKERLKWDAKSALRHTVDAF